MRGIKVNFSAGGASFDFSKPVKDFDVTVQNALVNVGTALGSDPYFEERGTDLLLDGVQGRMVNAAWANHAANFAALKTLVFIQSQDSASDPYRLSNFRLQALRFTGQTVELRAKVFAANGQVRGTVSNF